MRSRRRGCWHATGTTRSSTRRAVDGSASRVWCYVMALSIGCFWPSATHMSRVASGGLRRLEQRQNRKHCWLAASRHVGRMEYSAVQRVVQLISLLMSKCMQ
jgi:hypothetical protein